MPPKKRKTALHSEAQNSALYGGCGIGLEIELRECPEWFQSIFGYYCAGLEFKTLLFGYIDALTNHPDFQKKLRDTLHDGSEFNIYKTSHIILRNKCGAKSLTTFVYNRVCQKTLEILNGNNDDPLPAMVDAEGDAVLIATVSMENIKKTRGIVQLKKKLDDFAEELDGIMQYHTPKAPKKSKDVEEERYIPESQNFDLS